MQFKHLIFIKIWTGHSNPLKSVWNVQHSYSISLIIECFFKIIFYHLAETEHDAAIQTFKGEYKLNCKKKKHKKTWYLQNCTMFLDETAKRNPSASEALGQLYFGASNYLLCCCNGSWVSLVYQGILLSQLLFNISFHLPARKISK